MRSAPPNGSGGAPPCRGAAIVTYSTSGSTVLRVARERPEVPNHGPHRFAVHRAAPCPFAGPRMRADLRLKRFSEMVERPCGSRWKQEMAKVGERDW